MRFLSLAVALHRSSVLLGVSQDKPQCNSHSTLLLISSYSGLHTLLALSRKGVSVISGKGVTSAIVLGLTRSYGKGISVKQIGSGSSSSSLIFNSLIAAVG